MRLIVVREPRDGRPEDQGGLLRYALSTAPLHDAVLDGLRHLWGCGGTDEPAERIGWTNPDDLLWLVPQAWRAGLTAAPGPAVFYGDSASDAARELEDRRRPAWAVIVNGRFAAHVNHSLVAQLLGTTRADGLAVTATADLLVCRERLRVTPDNQIVGYRRLYADAMAPVPVPQDWPHYLFVRREAWGAALQGGLLSSFEAWVERCRTAGLKLQGAAVAGSAHDLETEEGICAVAHVALRRPLGPSAAGRPVPARRESRPGEDAGISPQAHLVGPVLLGRNVTIEAGAVIVGPAILCDGCTVGREALVDSAIIGAQVVVAPGQALAGGMVTAHARPPGTGGTGAAAGRLPEHVCSLDRGVFRTWPRFSYAHSFKRVADTVAAVLVLVLFAPVIPVIALAVKISSPGPAFFRDKRQGLHGRNFHCIKFRTMRPGADKIQDKLRFVSEVDGPQFKMADDPRITTVGRFLRETYLDEIPQFFNVLRGQMSVVGPRPSPESENRLCPAWRDARLSVRPGITGLWQVLRTREPTKDFQEWIHFDTQYVRDFSFGLDLWICWRTFTKMVENFVRQF
jgi:lipopolysaccharide/colanic/teichoic acid biosynthesis glycosyltransferase